MRMRIADLFLKVLVTVIEAHSCMQHSRADKIELCCFRKIGFFQFYFWLKLRKSTAHPLVFIVCPFNRDTVISFAVSFANCQIAKFKLITDIFLRRPLSAQLISDVSRIER